MIVSLTTIPPRFGALHETLRSILEQTAAPARIVVNIPAQYARFGEAGLPPPLAGVEYHRCPVDYGPATKLLALADLPDWAQVPEDTPIVVVDDDRAYAPDLCATLLAALQAAPDAAHTVTGLEIEHRSSHTYAKPQPRGVPLQQVGLIDTLAGCCGFILRKGVIPSAPEFRQLGPEHPLRYVDDFWISGWLALERREIRVAVHRDADRTKNDAVEALFDWAQHPRFEKDALAIDFFREKGVWV